MENVYFQREIADSAYKYQQALDRKEKIIVGVNEFVEENEVLEIPILKIPKSVEETQVKRLKELKASRNQEDVENSLKELRLAASNQRNIMPAVIECARKYVTLGEMCNELKKVYGIFHEQSVF
ncbi:MAG: methylmalonyl-CoA mutase family protein [Ignavibacteria bacterium]